MLALTASIIRNHSDENKPLRIFSSCVRFGFRNVCRCGGCLLEFLVDCRPKDTKFDNVIYIRKKPLHLEIIAKILVFLRSFNTIRFLILQQIASRFLFCAYRNVISIPEGNIDSLTLPKLIKKLYLPREWGKCLRERIP